MSSTSDDEIWNCINFIYQVQEEIEREVQQKTFDFFIKWYFVPPKVIHKTLLNHRFSMIAPWIFKTHLLIKVTFDKLIKDFFGFSFLLSEEATITHFNTTILHTLQISIFFAFQHDSFFFSASINFNFTSTLCQLML